MELSPEQLSDVMEEVARASARTVFPAISFFEEWIVYEDIPCIYTTELQILRSARFVDFYVELDTIWRRFQLDDDRADRAHRRRMCRRGRR